LKYFCGKRILNSCFYFQADTVISRGQTEARGFFVFKGRGKIHGFFLSEKQKYSKSKGPKNEID
jgi:hypothetical protein